MFSLYVKKKIAARIRDRDGTDRGFTYLIAGNYLAKDTPDGYVEIVRPHEQPLYLMSIIFWDKIRTGTISVISGPSTTSLH